MPPELRAAQHRALQTVRTFVLMAAAGLSMGQSTRQHVVHAVPALSACPLHLPHGEHSQVFSVCPSLFVFFFSQTEQRGAVHGPVLWAEQWSACRCCSFLQGGVAGTFCKVKAVVSSELVFWLPEVFDVEELERVRLSGVGQCQLP